MTWISYRNTATGRSHIRNGVPCQDYVSYHKNDHLSIIALSDGAGSRAKSSEAAHMATNELSQYILEHSIDLYSMEDYMVATTVVDQFHSLISTQFEEQDFEQFACTFQFVLMDEENENYLLGHIGDGAIGVRNGESWEVRSEPENGEFHNTTYFLNSIDATERLRVIHGNLENLKGFVMMSDGTSESLYNRSEKCFAQAVETMYQWAITHEEQKVQEAIAYNLETIIRDKTEDDCSLHILCRVEEE